MKARAAVTCLLLSLPLVAAASGQASVTSAPAVSASQGDTTRAKLEATRGQAQTEDKHVKDLKKRVDALESNSAASRQALEERDRKIAELERQLKAEQHP